MPALPEEMYCSEQIIIPPSFPYLLRQYAKAAIRTQPIDLLKWSTAYFRCLSLNIPPPVKPRLEYPIPRDFHGITPGWLKALLYQLQNNPTISFKILWDRWIGACLEHNTLVKILCLGGFEDPQAIPWLRFVALCAATLTDDMTHTMVLLCEILTEEPEGGSAMIPIETFLDLYKFLANIDASKDQVLKNFWFRDSLLSLWRERVEKEEVVEEVLEELQVESEQSEATKTSSESVEKLDEEDEMEKVVSCPSLPEDDHYSLELLKNEVSQEEEVEGEGHEQMGEEEELMREEVEEEFAIHDEEDGAVLEEQMEEIAEIVPEEGKQEMPDADEFAAKPDQLNEKAGAEKTEEGPEKQDTEQQIQRDGSMSDLAKTGSVKSEDLGTHVRDVFRIFENEEQTLKEDLERLKALQQEMAGETDDELEKFKCRLIEEMPLTESQEEAIKHFGDTNMSTTDKLKLISEQKLARVGEASSESQEGEEERPFDEIFCEAIPGIGEIVPELLVRAVEDYMKNCAKIQHGIVMPRNIRHYSCPPLESLEY